MNEQRKAFEAWHNEKFRWMSARDPIGSHGYLDQRTQGLWDAWQAALASQSPKEAMSDAEILAIQVQHVPHHGWSTNGIGFARAIIAATSPNKELVEASIASLVWWKEHEYDTSDCGEYNRFDDEPEFVIKARAALCAAGVEVP